MIPGNRKKKPTELKIKDSRLWLRHAICKISNSEFGRTVSIISFKDSKHRSATIVSQGTSRKARPWKWRRLSEGGKPSYVCALKKWTR